MIDESSRLLEQAKRCREIAQTTNDSEAVAMLLCLARSYEAKANQLPQEQPINSAARAWSRPEGPAH
jgi:hypothetical protein